MASSDDEVEGLPEFVLDYHFEDENGEPISFSALPIKWSHDVIGEGRKKKIFMHGTHDNGLQLIYKPVTAWKFDLSGVDPVISVLWKDNNWFKLHKPRKSFVCIIRSILITVRCLHIVKNDPDASGKLLWDQLSKSFSVYEVRPSENDLIDHMQLIEEAFKMDEYLTKSKFLARFLEKRPQKKKVVNEDIPSFLVDNEDDECISEEEEESFAVCVICDNGGNVTTCDGICMRSFHATPEDAIGSDDEDAEEVGSPCDSLGLSKSELAATPYFYCKNCLHKQHQCFSCGKLGSSDKNSGAAEVFQCASATCGFFYHPGCLAKLLHPNDEATAEELRKNVASGGPFTCPCHRCHVCKQMEDAANPDLQFAVCRRCPKSYHRKCLPRRICFERTDEDEQRAWEELLPNNRILIFCLKHRIIPELGTPIRNHIKFPGEEDEKNKVSLAQSLINNKATFKKRSLVSGSKQLDQVLLRSDRRIENFSLTEQGDQRGEKNEQKVVTVNRKKARATDVARSTVIKRKQVVKRTNQASTVVEGKVSMGKQLYAQFSKQPDSPKPRKLVSEVEPMKVVNTDVKQSESSLYELDVDSMSRIDDLMRDAESSITSKSIYEKHSKLASKRAHSQKAFLETITLGKVEGFRQAIDVASRKLDEGGNVEEAMAVCGPSVLNQILRWKQKLRTSISPFLHGMRYTSFGRHFTKADKLKEIVDMIHWYVENGDTVVDFCCGANDFSCLMKEKLDQTGKKCSYRNFDLFRPKNDFAFERRDWMSVKGKELPTGSQLIMGLNPPFGVRAALANKFINKALEFKPKLMILIVPRETERLDEKKPPYDLVWEDFEILSGKSFYLPGSIDKNDKQMDDWNVVSPVLYLWSRPDFTRKYKEIGEKHGHLSGKRGLLESHSTEDNLQVADMEIDDDPPQVTKPEELKMRRPVDSEDHKVQSSQNKITKGETHAADITESSSGSKQKSKKRQREKKLLAGDISKISPGQDRFSNDTNKGGRRPSHEPFLVKHHYTSSNPSSNPRSSPLDGYFQRNQEPLLPIPCEGLDMGYARGNHPQTGFMDLPGFQYRSEYNVSPPSFTDNCIPRRFGPENEDPHLSRRPGWQAGFPHPFVDPPPTPYTRGAERFVHHRAYNSEMDSGYRESELLYGRGRTAMPAMERHAPRLDELNNHVGMGSVGPNLSWSGSGGGGVGAGVGIYDYQPAPRGVPMGFMPGQHRLSSRQSSGGWIFD